MVTLNRVLRLEVSSLRVISWLSKLFFFIATASLFPFDRVVLGGIGLDPANMIIIRFFLLCSQYYLKPLNLVAPTVAGEPLILQSKAYENFEGLDISKIGLPCFITRGSMR